MNKIFKVIYNHHTQSFQAVCEYGKSHTTTSSTSKPNKSSFFKAKILSVFVGGLMSSVAIASPTNGAVTAGQAVINQNELITNINQSSQNAAINWQSFNVGKNETVNFHQPNAQSVTLNRVIGNERSVIDGAMNANGKVFISNANGMMIGKNAQINVGGLVATTANISDDDLMNGRYRFAGGENGSIENLGHISVPKGGVVALVAPIVKNSGTITAHKGKVLLASAESFSITLPDNANFAYTLDKGTLQGLVDNGGAILADAGRVVLTAKGVDTVKKSLIKHSGNIEANTVQNKNGVIELLGDLDNSALNVSGSLKAEGKGDDKGGFIETSSAQLNFDDNAVISTKSETGQTGTWLIDPKDFVVAPTGGDITGAKVSAGLQSNNVTLKSRDGAKEGIGDVIVNDEIRWDKNTLTLNAENDIHINKTMNGSGTAKLALEYGQGTADGGKSDYHLYKNTPLKDRTVKVNLPEGKNFSTKKGSDGEVVEFDVIHKMPEIVKNADGEWENNFTTQNIAFGKDIDLSYTKNHQGFAGWQLPDNEGKISGLGHTVSNLTLRTTKDNQNTGLFQENDYDKGYFRDIGVTNVNIRSEGSVSRVGGLVADNGYNISNSYVTGNISTAGNNSEAGGLVGRGGMIDKSYSTADISTVGDHSIAGGLVGGGWGIRNSYATGNVSTIGQDSYAGGLGGSSSDIYNSYATGNVSTIGQDSYAGGLGGYGANINNSYATGNVSTSGEQAYAGGLVGRGSETSNSYATGNVSTSGEQAYAGGLIGIGEYIENSYATGNVSTSGELAHAGGLAGEGEWVFYSYADNQVKVVGKNSVISGVIGYYSERFNSETHDVFFNKDKNPNLSAIGKFHENVDESKIVNVIGKTESELKQKSTFAGWDETIWNIQDGKLPTLRHTANTVTTPTVPPVTPPINNVDFEPAKKSLADTKLYRQNMLNRMVIFAKNGEFTKLNIDQINDNIRKEIAKTQALIDVLPDGAEKTNLQNQLNAITVLTRDEIQNAEKVSNDVATEKQKRATTQRAS